MKKIISLLLTLIVISFCNSVFAQQNYFDAVYLKNGSIINGTIIEQVPGQSIKIETKDKNVFVFREDEIEKIVKGTFVHKKGRDEREPAPEERKVSSTSEPHTGYMFGFETAIGPGASTRNQSGFGMAAHIINGVTYKSILSFGLGLGYDLYTLGYYADDDQTYYDDYSRTYLNMAYYFDFRAFPIQGKVSPLIIFNYGYAYTMFSSKVTGGPFLGAGFGTRFRFTPRFGLNMSVNYKIQRFRYKDTIEGYYGSYPYTYYNKKVDEKFNLEYLNLVIGLSF